MAKVPELSKKPDYASTSGGTVQVPFPGEGVAGWQMGALLASFSVFVGTMPGLGSLATVFMPALLLRLRRQSTPKLELDKDQVKVTVSGREVRLSPEATGPSQVVRQGKAWALLLQTEQGPLTLERTGASPAELQWTAELLEAWRTGAPRAPALRDAVVEQGLGATTFVVSSRWAAGDLAVAAAMLVFMAAVWLWGAITLGVGHALSGLLTAPMAGLLGHLVGERRTARTEIQVREQALGVCSIGGRQHQQTVALEDVRAVEQRSHAVVLTLREGTLTLPAQDCAPALAEAIETRRQRLEPPSPAEGEARVRLAELSRSRERARS
jgi:hypothetical protein